MTIKQQNRAEIQRRQGLLAAGGLLDGKTDVQGLTAATTNAGYPSEPKG
jgi:hypothetical protein